jgi:hypothetical protein
MPGMLALFEEPVLTHAAPVGGVKDAEGITHPPIGHRDRSPAFRDANVPLTNDQLIDGLSSSVASMSIWRVFSLTRALVAGQGWNTHPFGVDAFLLCPWLTTRSRTVARSLWPTPA